MGQIKNIKLHIVTDIKVSPLIKTTWLFSNNNNNNNNNNNHKMSVFHDEVEIEDFSYDEDVEVYYYPCPCGDRFEITRDMLCDGEDVATCPSCSLIIKVVYNIDEFMEGEEVTVPPPPVALKV